MNNQTTRRAVIGAMAALPVAALAAPTLAETASDVGGTQPVPGRPDYELARAWIDRWEALGGYFGFAYDGEGRPTRLLRGMTVDGDLWTPTDRGHPKLPPHTWLVAPGYHSGGVRVLEGLLFLSPALAAAVRDIAATRAFTAASQPVEA